MNYRESPRRLPVAAASAAVDEGDLVAQFGVIGVALTAAAEGDPFEIAIADEWLIAVPSGTVETDFLYAEGQPPFADGPVTVTRTAAGNTPIARAMSTRDAAGRAHVLLLGVLALATPVVSAAGPTVVEGPHDVCNLVGDGAPTDGTAAVWTLTFTAITSGTFKLQVDGVKTAAITWSSTDATLVSRIDAALEALTSIGNAGVVTADSTLTSGLGDATLTFAKKHAFAIEVTDAALVGEGAEITIDDTTPGVDPTGYDVAGPASEYRDYTNAKVYINSGTKAQPVWKELTQAGA